MNIIEMREKLEKFGDVCISHTVSNYPYNRLYICVTSKDFFTILKLEGEYEHTLANLKQWLWKQELRKSNQSENRFTGGNNNVYTF